MGDFKYKEASLQKGFKVMESFRLGDGKWNRYPFFYAIYTLADLDIEPAIEELRYARPVMERYVKRPHQDTYSKRRFAIINKALEKIS